ncbi:hypothetical protein ACSLVP_27560, partial [Klebsiella pneumoniae]|uniref:hypothetical protein n=1 Tax=Klebsiella pneumoniae TaxID=573 RepID=UPI003EE0D9B0
SRAMNGEAADLIFTDPLFAADFSADAFSMFWKQALGNVRWLCRDGAIAFVGVDKDRLADLICLARPILGAFLDLCIWV